MLNEIYFMEGGMEIPGLSHDHGNSIYLFKEPLISENGEEIQLVFMFGEKNVLCS